MSEDDEDEAGFFQKHRFAVSGTMLVVLGGAVLAGRNFMPHPKAPATRQPTTVIAVAPPPVAKPVATPPPVKPLSTPPPRMIPATAAIEPAGPVNPAPTKTAHLAGPAPLSSTIHGPDPLPGLIGSGAPGIGGIGEGADGLRRGSRFGTFLSSVQTSVTDALHVNPRTRTARMKLTVRIWPNATGRVVKARISPGTGDASLDRLIQDGILTGMQLASAPPADMPVPIVMNVTAERP